MANNRDWMDYANTAARVEQARQLSNINSKMSDMASLMRDQAYREQQEAAVARCEEMLREAVFFYAEKLKDVEAEPGQKPSELYIRASHLRGTYEKMPEFKSSGFRQYEDKERLSGVQRAYDKLIRETGEKMGSDELDQCQRCVQHIFDRDELLRLIAIQKEKEVLDQENAKQPAWQAEQESQLQQVTVGLKARTPVWYKLVNAVRVISIAVVFGSQAWLAVDYCSPTDNSDKFWVLLAISCLTAAGAHTLLSHSEFAKGRKGLKQTASRLKHNLETRPGELILQADYIASKARPLHVKFGVNTLEGYQKLLAERDALLEQKLGAATGEFTKRTLPSGDEDDLFNLNIISIPWNNWIKVVKLVSEIKRVEVHEATGFAKTPCALLSKTSKGQAESAAALLKNAGAVVEVVPAR